MASLREQILANIATRLDEIVGITVERSRLVAARRNDGIVVVVTPLGEEVETQLQMVERRLTVLISIRARGSIPDQVADATAVLVYSKLMATHTTRTLGNLALPMVELSRTFTMEDADLDAIDYQMQFLITYHTTLGDETVAA